MQIVIQQRKALALSSELYALSRQMRKAGWEIGDTAQNLRLLSGMDGCERELLRQQEAAQLLTARLTSLAAALSDISELYEKAEARAENGIAAARLSHQI